MILSSVCLSVCYFVHYGAQGWVGVGVESNAVLRSRNVKRRMVADVMLCESLVVG